VVRISDRDPALLQHLFEEGVVLDTLVTVVERRPFGGALAVRTPASALDLGDEAAAAIWLASSAGG
jgi:DtxR family Mn-dependent transcriptional regulator